jgi:hypothetical protein
MEHDSLRLVLVSPVDSLAMLSPEVVQIGRRAAQVTARGWVDRWLAASPADHRAHSLMSQTLELAGDWPGALGALRTADSLERAALGSRNDGYGARRMVLLSRLGRFAEAAGPLDSLWRAGFFANVRRGVPFPRDGFVALAWASGLLLREGSFSRADSALVQLGAFCGCEGADRDRFVISVLTGGFPNPSRQWWAYEAAALSPGLQRVAAGRVRVGLDGLPVGGILSRIAPDLLRAAGG